jgi:hypothetical protein
MECRVEKLRFRDAPIRELPLEVAALSVVENSIFLAGNRHPRTSRDRLPD